MSTETTDYRPRFAAHFKFWVRRCGLSHLEVAQRLGVDPSSVSCWANGKNFPSLTMLYRLCEDAFGIHLWQFFERPRSAWKLKLVPRDAEAIAT